MSFYGSLEGLLDLCTIHLQPLVYVYLWWVEYSYNNYWWLINFTSWEFNSKMWCESIVYLILHGKISSSRFERIRTNQTNWRTLSPAWKSCINLLKICFNFLWQCSLLLKRFWVFCHLFVLLLMCSNPVKVFFRSLCRVYRSLISHFQCEILMGLLS